MRFNETVRRLEAEVDEGLFTRGVQVSVALGGERVFDHVLGDDGMGRPMTHQTLMRVYCTLKPVAAIAVGHLVAAGNVDLDQPLNQTLPEVAALQGEDVTARHVLTHTAGLHTTSGVTLELVPPSERDAFMNAQTRPPGWRVGRDAGYSEVLGWHVLGQLIERVTGGTLSDHLRTTVLEPLGMRDTYIGMTEAELSANIDRVGVNVDLRGWRPYPMLFERTPRILRETNPAHGGYTTARDLESLYSALLRAQDGERVDGLPPTSVLNAFLTTARQPAYDVILGRECDHGLGFMTNLPSHHFGAQLSAASYGHSGNVGSSFAFADPTSRLAVAVVLNGITDPDSAFLRRPVIVRAICHDLALREPSEDHQAQGQERDRSIEPPSARRRLRLRRRSPR